MSATLSATPPLTPPRYWWVLHALAIGVACSFAVHLIMLALNFTVPQITLNRQQDRGLEVVLVNAKHATAPKDPQALAQANLDGGGNVEQKVRTTSPLPAEHTERPGDSLVDAQRRVEALENLQRNLMVQAHSQTVVPAGTPMTTPDTTPAEDQADAPQITGIDFSAQVRAIARQEAIVERNLQAYAQRPRKTFIGARTQEYRFAQYVEDWRTKIQRIGTLNYPVARDGNRLYGSLLVSVEVRADGSVNRASVERSSGKSELDAAALRIIQQAAPFAPFPPDIRKDTDILVINRTWTFARDTLETE